MTKITKKLVENVDFELIPEGRDHWQIRILEGDYSQTVISFGQLRVDESAETLKFDFTVDYTPDDAVSSDNQELQEHAAHILHSILEDATSHE